MWGHDDWAGNKHRLAVLHVCDLLLAVERWQNAKQSHLDDDNMVWVLSRGVQDGVGGDHIIHHIGFADLVAAEGLVGAQVHAIIVAQVIVGHDGCGLDTSAHQEVHQHRLELGLPALKVITSNQYLRQINWVDI